jgi:hypothetical protein
VPFVFDQLCEAGKTVAGKAGDIVTAPFRAAAGGAVDILTSWVADSAQWLLTKVIGFIDHSTSPTLRAAWFSERYDFMVGLAALVVLPMLLIAAIRAVVRQDIGQLLRSFFVYLPIAIFGTFIAIFLVRTLLEVTDALSDAVAHGITGDVSQIFDAVGSGLSDSVGGAAPGAPSFAIFFGALLLIIGAFFVWLELLVRSAAVTVSVFFLPLILAGLVWPSTARWTRRLIETLIALILSKFVIVAVISLATAALADPGGGGFGAVMGGAALMLMAAFSPFALLKLMPAVEGAAVSHLEGMGRKPVHAAARSGPGSHALSIMRSKVSGGSGSQMAVASAVVPSNAASVAGAARKAGSAVDPGKRLDKATTPASRPSGGKAKSASAAKRPPTKGSASG